VRLSLFGHTHYEAFNVVKGIKDNKNIGINYVGGSVTTFTGFNPGFIVIDLDEEYLVPLNFKSYYFNVTNANLGNPKWELLHDIKEGYGINDTSPNGLFSLAQKIL